MASNAVNISDMERIFSASGGAIIAILGMTRRSLGGLALTTVGSMLLHRGLSGYCSVYDALESGTDRADEDRRVQISEIMTINRPRAEIYGRWRDFERLPRFMHHIESIEQIDDKHSRWRARLPKTSGTLSWEAEITQDQPNARIAWRSLPGADIENSGEVSFQTAPANRGTEIRIVIDYRPPAGPLGRAVAGLINPGFSRIIRDDIRRFKALMETGEIPTIDGQPTGN